MSDMSKDLPLARLSATIKRIDAENAQDPHTVLVGGQLRARELAYAEWLTGWVLQLRPDASQELLLAARSQHICRWMIPRDSYEMSRAGYLRWRAELKKFHAEKTAAILRACGYDEETIARVRTLNLKQDPANDPEYQTLEDALCLVTLQYQLGDLLAKTGAEKLASILQRTWRKMSPAAQAKALQLTFPPDQAEVIKAALAGASS